ncbi:STAS domain-containing protein [Actinocorallia longicatena]|uniref:STAS domain-containing protein n=1 Tax=Actinocorallia longicatena TaxID=111803 RepID=A0ABP6Q456_9ACTN
MTSFTPSPLLLTWRSRDPGTLTAELEGDLDYATAGELLEAATERLAARPDLVELRLDCSRLGVCDSMGLSVLLLIRRRTALAGTALRLDHRPAALDRMLDMTGVLEHLTGDPATADGADGAVREDEHSP